MSEMTNGLRACLLIYDIPDSSGVPNPSPRLRRLAVRANLSCWIIPESEIPYALLDRMRQGGASWHVVRFDAAEAGKLVAMAAEAIRRELRAAIDRARRAARRAEERLESPGGTAGGYAERGRAVVRRLKRLLEDVQAAAARFGIAEGEAGILGAVSSVEAIQAGMEARARIYAESAATARTLLGAGDGMAAAVDADAVPAGIVADYLDDHGADTSALRSAFPAD